MMVSKTETVKILVANGNYKKALQIAKNFRLGIDIQDSSKLKLAYENLVHKAFYKQIGIDTEKAINEGINILIALYGQDE